MSSLATDLDLCKIFFCQYSDDDDDDDDDDDLCCSYNVDNADGTESQGVRLKSCLYHEETASTCSVTDQSTASKSTLSLKQPTKLRKMSSGRQSDRQTRRTDDDVTVKECDGRLKTKNTDESKPLRYCNQH